MTLIRTMLLLAAVCLLAADRSPSFLIRDALAEDKCTNWMPQPNGCSFRTCVDDRGRQFCEQACGRNAPTRVSCR